MAEYERELAREWSKAVDYDPKRHPQSKLVPRLPFKRDNLARGAWRENQPPIAKFSLPENFSPPEPRRGRPERGRSRGDERATSPGAFGLPPEIGQIAHDTQTMIEARAHGAGIDCNIWGDNARLAIKKLAQWVKSYDYVEKHETGWAKIAPINAERRARMEAVARLQQERDKYSRYAPPDAVFNASGMVLWKDEWESPELLLGGNLEACDPIRGDCSVYISRDQYVNAITVMGAQPSQVDTALDRVRGTTFQSTMRARVLATENHILLCGTEDIPPTVPAYLEEYFPGRSMAAKAALEPEGEKSVAGEKSIGVKLYLEEYEPPLDRQRFSERDVLAIEKHVSRILPTLQWHRSHVQMQARLGTFVIDKYHEDTKTWGAMKKMLESDGEARVYESEVRLKLEPLLERMSYAHLVHPVREGSIERAMTSFVRPTLSGAFLMMLPSEQDGPSFYKLDVKYTYDDDGNSDCIAKGWSVLGPDPGNPMKMLDLCLVDLTSDSSAWNLEVKCFDIMTNRHPLLDAFADSVTLDYSLARTQKQPLPFLRYKAEPGLILQTLMQKTTYSFDYGNTGYVCDVTQRRAFVLRNPQSQTPNQYALDPRPELVDISVSSPRWDAMLAENGILGVGQWRRSPVTMEALFPAAHGGIRGFLNILDQFWTLALIRMDKDKP